MNENVALLFQFFMKRSAFGKRDVILLVGSTDLHKHMGEIGTVSSKGKESAINVATSKGKARH